jgi:drug/metabolite transporter (DMT)-like permease
MGDGEQSALTLRIYIQILLVVVLMAAGQFLFQSTARTVPPLRTISGLGALMSSSLFILALIVYAAATILWTGVLQQAPLSRAYPFTALSFVAVPIVAVMFRGEPASWRLLLGLFLFFVGLLLIAGDDAG